MTLESAKQTNLARAKNLLAVGDAHSLRYCALELRMCMELLCYERMSVYTDEISEELQKQWNPREVVNLLLEIDPESDQTATFSFARERPDGTTDAPVHLGSVLGISKKFINEHYHRLGSLLHAPTLREWKTSSESTEGRHLVEKFKESIQATIDALEPLCKNVFQARFASFIFFTCQVCKTRNKRDESSLKADELIDCIGLTCPAQFKVSGSEAGSCFFEVAETLWQCAECKSVNSILPKQIVVGHEVDCSNCRKKFQFSIGLVGV